MPEEPHHKILNRELTRVEVKELYGPAINLLNEVAAYGSNLIPRCLVSSDRKLTDFVIVAVLGKHAVTMVDGVAVLATEGAVTAAHVPARVLFEVYLSVLWILRSDPERRAKLYYVWNLRQERVWAQRLISGTPESQAFASTYSRFNMQAYPASSKKSQDVVAQVSAIDRLLSGSSLSGINAEFDNLNTRGFDVHWSRPDNAGSVWRMAIELGAEAEYRMIYSTFSEVVHGTKYSTHIQFDGDTVRLSPIRGLQGMDTLLTMTLSYAITLYRVLLKQYRAGEEENFARKYVEEWGERFRSIPPFREA